jgi:hypothetical protein
VIEISEAPLPLSKTSLMSLNDAGYGTGTPTALYYTMNHDNAQKW